MSELLAGKGAIVTGGTSGIGQAIVEVFRRNGANVLFTGRDIGRGEQVAAATGAIFFASDAAQPEYPALVVDKAIASIGRIDVLVNNAGGFGTPCGAEDISRQILGEAIAIHLEAPWMLMARAAPLMRANGGGSIVNMSSVAAQRIGGASLAYSVAKAALVHLTRGAAAEFGKDNIRVNSVSPGFITTPIHTSHLDVGKIREDRIAAGLARFYMSRQALRQNGSAADVANAVMFLASEQSSFITGADIVLDGGMIWGHAIDPQRWA